MVWGVLFLLFTFETINTCFAFECVSVNQTNNLCGFSDEYLFILPPNVTTKALDEYYSNTFGSSVSDISFLSKRCGSLFKEVTCKSVYRRCTDNIPWPMPICRDVCQDLNTCLIDTFGEEAASSLTNCSSVTSALSFSIPDFADRPNCNTERPQTLTTDCVFPMGFNEDHEKGFDGLCGFGCLPRFHHDGAAKVELILVYVFAPVSMIIGLFAVIVSTRVALKNKFPLSLHALLIWYTWLSILGYLPSLFSNPRNLVCLNSEVSNRQRDSALCTIQGLWLFHFLELSNYTFLMWVYGMIYTFRNKKPPHKYIQIAFVIIPWIIVISMDIYFLVRKNFGSSFVLASHCFVLSNSQEMNIALSVTVLFVGIVGSIGIILFAALVSKNYMSLVKIAGKHQVNSKLRFIRSQAVLIVWMVVFIYFSLVSGALTIKTSTYSDKRAGETFYEWVECERATPGQCEWELIPPWWHTVWGMFNVFSRPLILFLGCLVIKAFLDDIKALYKMVGLRMKSSLVGTSIDPITVDTKTNATSVRISKHMSINSVTINQQ